MEILPQLLVNSLISGSIYALITAGLALCYGVLRILNFAHGHLLMLGAYLFYLYHEELSFGFIGSGLMTILFTCLLSALFFWIFIWKFQKLSPLLTLVSTLALSIMIESVVAMLFGVNVKSLSSSASFESYSVMGIYITPVQICILSLSALVFLLLLFIIHYTSTGRRLQALREHADAAEALGIDSGRLYLAVFAGSSLLAALAGVMVGYETNLQPTMGNAYTIKAFAAMVLGGLGNIWGAFAGSYILGLVENLSIGLEFGDFSMPAGYKDAFAFVIILAVLILRPRGLFGSVVRRA